MAETRINTGLSGKFSIYAGFMKTGDGGIRTHDLYTASVALSQLSYAPKWSRVLNLFYNTGKEREIQPLFSSFFAVFCHQLTDFYQILSSVFIQLF